MTRTEEESAPPMAPPGLKGLIVADTEIGSVRGSEGFFHYRDRDATEVAAQHSFESIVGLLLEGEVASGGVETELRAQLGNARRVDTEVIDLLRTMVALGRTPVECLSATIPLLLPSAPSLDQTASEREAAVMRVAGAFPTVLAAAHQLTLGRDPLEADPALGHAADWVRMVSGANPPAAITRAVEVYLNLTADHGFNASTFTSRVITSTGASVPGALAGALAALSGPLHGGAPSRVLDMLDEIGDPANTETWALDALENNRKIMGFGHAVYRADDPRSTLLASVAHDLGGELVERATEIEQRMLAGFRSWKPTATIVTNVEFYAAVVLHLAGIPQEMFTPTFATSRVFGWGAHLLEQAADNKIMRPSARYVGPPIRTA